jgi:hypothetical protein
VTADYWRIKRTNPRQRGGPVSLLTTTLLRAIPPAGGVSRPTASMWARNGELRGRSGCVRLAHAEQLAAFATFNAANCAILQHPWVGLVHDTPFLNLSPPRTRAWTSACATCCRDCPGAVGINTDELAVAREVVVLTTAGSVTATTCRRWCGPLAHDDQHHLGEWTLECGSRHLSRGQDAGFALGEQGRV